MKNLIITASLLWCLGGICRAQPPATPAAQPSDASTRKAAQAYEEFRRKSRERYDSFRRKCNEEYAAFVRQAWQSFESQPPVPVPPRRDVPVAPRPYNGGTDDDQPGGNNGDNSGTNHDQPGGGAPDDSIKRKAPVELAYDEVVPAVKPEPQPRPVEPIKEQPADPDADPTSPATPEAEAPFRFTLYGTTMGVRLTDAHRFTMADGSENNVAQAWLTCSGSGFDNVVRDCLALRLKHGLSDWAYLRMLRAMATAFFGSRANEAAVLAAYVYCQSGYKMRLGRGASGRIYMLVASRHKIYRTAFFTIDGDNYYPIDCDETSMSICRAAFPQEKPLSLYISGETRLDPDPSPRRHLQSARYKDVEADVSVNRNLLSFYDDYPSSEISGDFMTRWAMYANTPLESEVRATLYSALRKATDGLSPREAAERLLNFVQTAFVYEYDENVWGADRAFFAEETLYYPYCDCEDRSVLFSRLIRDLLGLPVVLIYYPGHLATAVCFGENGGEGDCIVMGGRRFTVCDPTYIGAGVGQTMPSMDNGKAKVILLE